MFVFPMKYFFHEPLLPIESMYGIFTYIWLIFMVNVGKCLPYMDAMGMGRTHIYLAILCNFVGVVRGDLQGVVFCCSRVFPDFRGTPTKHLFNLSI